MERAEPRVQPPAERPPAVVLVRPQEQGNVGAVARAMANMGLDELVLVEPAVVLGATARARAVKAHHVLEAARRAPSLAAALAPFGRVVGTTSSRARSLSVPLVSPRELPARLAAAGRGVPTALVFGPEASGLTDEELARCGLVVRVPTASRQPTLNLAQAVLIVAYELYVASDREAGDGAAAEPVAAAPAPGPTVAAPAPAGELDGLFAQLEPILAEVGFARDDTFAGVLADLRRLAARSGATSREVSILRGICRRTQGELARRLRG